MSISAKDKEFMEQVAAYFRSTKSPLEPNGSIRDTASKFDINRNKARKILITTGDLESPITEEAVKMREQGLSIKEIAKNFDVSVATVSTALPYEDKVDNTLDPTEHAADVREYRAYEREQLKRQAGKATKKRDVPAAWKGVAMADRKAIEKDRVNLLRFRTGQFPGALNDRSREVLEQVAGNRLPPEPVEVIRLHMELYDEYSDILIDDDDAEMFMKYGKVEHGRSISRDVIVPRDIPLYALHYVIQRAFGWENSHLRQFELPDDRFIALTNHNASMWSCMVGVLFRSPLMDEDDEFWTDDYNGGSFKNWLRKKYTGPYLSQCHGEGILSCMEDMMTLDMKAEYYVTYAKAFNRETLKYDGEEYVSEVSSVLDYNGNRRPEPKPWYSDEVPYRVEIVRFEKIPSEGLRFLFERNPMALLERLPIDSVLAAGKFELPENCSEEERKYMEEQMANSGDEVYLRLEKYIKNIINEQIDSPKMQVQPTPVTDVLLYNYDFGDNWKIRITASENCPDLIDSGRITQSELDRANVKCREVYRPVLIARDGEMLIDDVGGIHGFADFLQKINPDLKGMAPEEKEEAKKKKKEYLSWAKSLGWHRDNPSNFNLL